MQSFLPGMDAVVAGGPAPPALRRSETSRAAAETISGSAAGLRQRVYEFLLRRGAHGATDEQVQDALDMNPSTQRPRRVELVRAGLVVDGGERRATRSGRQAVVWVAAEVRDA